MKWFKTIGAVVVTLLLFIPYPKGEKKVANKQNPLTEIIEQMTFKDELNIVSLFSLDNDYTLPSGLPSLLPSIDHEDTKIDLAKPAPTEVKDVPLSPDYKVNVSSIIHAQAIDDKLGGVLKNKGSVIINYAHQYNICPIFLTAIIMHESANGTSKFANDSDLNNVAGIMKEVTETVKSKKTGKNIKIKKSVPRSFASVDDSIEFTAKLLGGSQYAGGSRDTIAEIQREYCPVGASNDPRNLNKHWLGGVMGYMEKIWGKVITVRS